MNLSESLDDLLDELHWKNLKINLLRYLWSFAGKPEGIQEKKSWKEYLENTRKNFGRNLRKFLSTNLGWNSESNLSKNLKFLKMEEFPKE